MCCALESFSASEQTVPRRTVARHTRESADLMGASEAQRNPTEWQDCH